MVLDQPDRTVMLTDEEYAQFKQIVTIGGATPLQVGMVKAAVVGVNVLAACLGLILGMTVLRYVFNFWFDPDIYNNPVLSTIVVTAMIIMMGVVVYGAVRG